MCSVDHLKEAAKHLDRGPNISMCGVIPQKAAVLFVLSVTYMLYSELALCADAVVLLHQSLWLR